MHHKSVLTIGQAIGRPYHLQCACGTAGDFPKEEAAVAFFNRHVSRIGKSETSELSVPGAAQPKPKPPAPPAPPKASEGVPKADSKPTGGDSAKEVK
jgi:hypothetical protein